MSRFLFAVWALSASLAASQQQDVSAEITNAAEDDEAACAARRAGGRSLLQVGAGARASDVHNVTHNATHNDTHVASQHGDVALTEASHEPGNAEAEKQILPSCRRRGHVDAVPIHHHPKTKTIVSIEHLAPAAAVVVGGTAAAVTTAVAEAPSLPMVDHVKPEMVLPAAPAVAATAGHAVKAASSKAKWLWDLMQLLLLGLLLCLLLCCCGLCFLRFRPPHEEEMVHKPPVQDFYRDDIQSHHVERIEHVEKHVETHHDTSLLDSKLHTAAAVGVAAVPAAAAAAHLLPIPRPPSPVRVVHEVPHVQEVHREVHLVQAPQIHREVHLQAPHVEQHLVHLQAPHVEPHLVHLQAPHVEPHLVHLQAPHVEPHLVHLQAPHVEPHLVHLQAPHSEPHLVQVPAHQEVIRTSAPAHLMSPITMASMVGTERNYVVRAINGMKLEAGRPTASDIYDHLQRPVMRALVDVNARDHPAISLHMMPHDASQQYGAMYACSRNGTEPIDQRKMFVYDADDHLFGELVRDPTHTRYELVTKVPHQSLTFEGNFAAHGINVTDARKVRIAHTEPCTASIDPTAPFYQMHMAPEADWPTTVLVLVTLMSIEMNELELRKAHGGQH